VALSEARQFAREHWADRMMMVDLLAQCEEDEDANPEHQIALKDRGLLALACKLEHGQGSLAGLREVPSLRLPMPCSARAEAGTVNHSPNSFWHIRGQSFA